MRFDDCRFFPSPSAAGLLLRARSVLCRAIQLRRRGRCGKQTWRRGRKAEWQREWPDKNQRKKLFFAFLIRFPFCLRRVQFPSLLPKPNVESSF